MSLIVVDIAAMAVSDQRDDILVTYSLGSCLGVCAWDAEAGIGGMAHCMLPLSSVDPQRAAQQPCMFVDTGVPLLLNSLLARGARKARLTVKAAGCAKVADSADIFKIGERNYTVFRKIMWKNGLLIAAEDVGGTASRTVRFEIGTGNVWVKSMGSEWAL